MSWRHACLVALLVQFSASSFAWGQYSRDGRSTKAELTQIREAVNSYIDQLPNWPYRSKDIKWSWTEVSRDNLDGRPGLEAQVHIYGEGLCGASACDNAIVVWRNGRAEVIDVINDSILSVSGKKSHGMHDLLGHYYSYRWDGKTYALYCEKGSDTVCERQRLMKESGK